MTSVCISIQKHRLDGFLTSQDNSMTHEENGCVSIIYAYNVPAVLLCSCIYYREISLSPSVIVNLVVYFDMETKWLYKINSPRDSAFASRIKLKFSHENPLSSRYRRPLQQTYARVNFELIRLKATVLTLRRNPLGG